MILAYDIKQRKRASTLLALAETELEASKVLLENRLYREAVVHLYFTCFYLSQAMLCNVLKTRATHKLVETEIHKQYGRKQRFPRRYVELHSRLHNLRNEIDYRSSHSPEPSILAREFKILSSYSKYVTKFIPEILCDDLLRDVVKDNPGKVFDFSIDVYCPKTYSHHTRVTVWFPPFYLNIFNTSKLTKVIREAFRQLKVKNNMQYVAGLNSKLDQYNDLHLLMIDIDSFDVEVESTLKKIGGTLFKSGRGYHFIGRHVIEGRDAWVKTLKNILRNPVLKDRVDKKHIEISLKRGYSTLRISSSALKTTIPKFYKEFW